MALEILRSAPPDKFGNSRWLVRCQQCQREYVRSGTIKKIQRSPWCKTCSRCVAIRVYLTRKAAAQPKAKARATLGAELRAAKREATRLELCATFAKMRIKQLREELASLEGVRDWRKRQGEKLGGVPRILAIIRAELRDRELRAYRKACGAYTGKPCYRVESDNAVAKALRPKLPPSVRNGAFDG